MKNLKRLGVAVTLMFVLAVAVFAGETSTPPCANPGEVNTPPCAAAQMSPGDFVDPGQTSTPPAANAGGEFSVRDLAISLFETLLSIF